MQLNIKVSFSKKLLLVLHRQISSFPKYDVGETREMLKQYPGGSVDLDTDPSTGIAMLTLNHPEKKNAITGHMMLDLEDNISKLESWADGKGVVVHGAGGTFCSGADLDLVKNILKPELGFLMSNFMHTNLSRLHNLPMISVALVEGSAFGGGAEITTACDFRVMTDSAKIGFVNMKMGVTPGFSGGTRLTRLLGKRHALDLLCSARILGCDNAKMIGLADSIIPSNENALETTKEWLIKNYCFAEPGLIRRVKQMVISAAELDMDSALKQERILFAQIWGGPAQKTALNKNLRHK